MSRLGDTIKQQRELRGFTPQALAKKCGVSAQVVIDVESGRRIITDELAQRMLKAMGVTSPISTELEVARDTRLNLGKGAPQGEDISAAVPLNVLRRVPILEENGAVVEHRLLPMLDEKIEGFSADQVTYFRCPDDTLRGFRAHAGDLLLCVPVTRMIDEAMMLCEFRGKVMARKVKTLDGGMVMLQSFDRSLTGEMHDSKNLMRIMLCIRLESSLV